MPPVLMQTKSVNWDGLRKFVAIRSLQGLPDENARAIEFIRAHLQKIGFNSRIEGDAHSHQPAIVAHRVAVNSNQRIVLYGHYDVATVNRSVAWRSASPFTCETIDGRVYARGIADNKGTLFVRMQALGEMVNAHMEMPEILWLIQGEEEIIHGERVAKKIFEHELNRFECDVVLEETGFNDIECDQPIAFVWSPNAQHRLLAHYRNLMKGLGFERIEFRTLQKLNGTTHCPLLSNLRHCHIYLGFGPNDMLHQIHRENESLDIRRLSEHKKKFIEFMRHYAKSCIAPTQVML